MFKIFVLPNRIYSRDIMQICAPIKKLIGAHILHYVPKLVSIIGGLSLGPKIVEITI